MKVFDYVELADPHERYKLLEAIERIHRVHGIVILPPPIESALDL